MFFRKRKTVEQAQKHLQKGNLEKALKEYQRLLREDPRDTSARLKVGDIHLRKGQVEEAIEAYSKVAEQFMHDGFDAKAVAIYKQIVKIDAKRYEVYVPLAELYQRLGLLSEALAAYQTAVDAAQRAGRHREALELLRKMATVDPANTTSRMKLAELLLQEELPGEAIAEYTAAAEELERQGEHEVALGVYGRVLKIDAESLPARLAAARATRTLGRLDDALRHVAKAREHAPESVEALELNAEILATLDRPEELESVHRRLAEVHRARGDEAAAREIVQRFVKPEPFETDAPSGPIPADEPEAVFELGNGADPVAEPRDFDASVDLGETAPAGVDAPAATRSSIAPGQPDQLLAEADVYVRYGKHDRAIRCLEQVLAGEPQHRSALERLGEALEVCGRHDEAGAIWTRAAAAARAAGDRTAFEALRARVGSADLDAAPSATDLPPPPPAEEMEPAIDEIEIDIDDLDELFTSQDAEPASEAGEIAIEGEIGIDDGTPADGGLATEDEIQIDAGAGLEIHAGPEAARDTEPSRQGPSVAEEVEEAEFYLQQGLRDEARRVFERVLARAPEHPHARRQLEALGAPVEPRSESPADAPAPNQTFGSERPREGLELPSDLFEEEASARALEQELGLDAGAPASPTPPAESAPADGGFDLGAELAEELDDEPDLEPEAPAAAGRTEEEGFQALFSEFKRGVSKTLGEGDYETRYDLGIAYREMGLYEDAIGEFRIALESPGRKGDALLMLGQCALDLDRPRDAVSHFEQALSLPEAGNAQSVNLRFQLGCAYEALGDTARARAAYEAVLRDAPDFPEARERLAELPGGSETELVTEAIDESAEPEESYESFDDVIAEAEALFGGDGEGGEGGPERPAPEADAPERPKPRRRRRVTYS